VSRVPTAPSSVLSNVCVTDDELVARARLGDTHAFGELVTRHQAAVIRTAFVVCRSRDEADDVAQEAFVSAWRRLATFRGDSQFKTWLLTIAWRHALTRRGSAWRRLFARSQQPDEEAVALRSAAPGAERAVAAGQTLQRVRQIVDDLPAKLRDPLLLAAGGECTFEEMSGMLGVPAGTLKWRVMEARRRVKSALAEVEG
jgi:RNA polymerase sigma-70 factor, ECF subfamily